MKKFSFFLMLLMVQLCHAQNINAIRRTLFYGIPFESPDSLQAMIHFLDSRPDSFCMTQHRVDSTDNQCNLYYEYRSLFTDSLVLLPVKIEIVAHRAKNQPVRVQRIRIAPLQWVSTRGKSRRLFRKINRLAGMKKIKTSRSFNGDGEFWRTKTFREGNITFISFRQNSNGNMWGLYFN